MAVALRGSWLMGAILAAIMLQHGQAIVEQCAACRRVSVSAATPSHDVRIAAEASS